MNNDEVTQLIRHLAKASVELSDLADQAAISMREDVADAVRRRDRDRMIELLTYGNRLVHQSILLSRVADLILAHDDEIMEGAELSTSVGTSVLVEGCQALLDGMRRCEECQATIELMQSQTQKGGQA